MSHLEYQKGAKGRPTVPLERCPYDLNHYISIKKFGTHLETCRRTHKLKSLELNGQVDIFVCQYNPNHLLCGPELDYHESRCPQKIRLYQLNIAPLREAGVYNFTEEFALSMTDVEEEIADIFSGIDIHMIQGQDEYERLFHIDDLKSAGAVSQNMAERRGAALAREIEMERLEDARVNKVSEATKEERNSGSVGFDMKQRETSSKLRIPCTLTKSERKRLEKHAGETGMRLTSVNSSSAVPKWPSGPIDELDEMKGGSKASGPIDELNEMKDGLNASGPIDELNVLKDGPTAAGPVDELGEMKDGLAPARSIYEEDDLYDGLMIAVVKEED